MFACCGGCHWPILAKEKLRRPIPVPLTVVSAPAEPGRTVMGVCYCWRRKPCWGCFLGVFKGDLSYHIRRNCFKIPYFWNLNMFDEHPQNHRNYDHYTSAVPNISPRRLCPQPQDPGTVGMLKISAHWLFCELKSVKTGPLCWGTIFDGIV